MATPPKKPRWAIEKDRARRAGPESVWLFGIHAVRDALANPARRRLRLILTPNARDRLGEVVEEAGIAPEMADPRRFPAPLDPQSVHQGAALEALPLDWGGIEEVCAPTPRDPAPMIVLLDRVTDPHNVGAILRSAEVFGARAVIAPRHHSAPETGALAKTASGALERQPYLRVRNLGDAMETLDRLGYRLVGLDGEGEAVLEDAVAETAGSPLGLVLGAEGPGLRPRTRALCHVLARIRAATDFASLNVSNAAAVALLLGRSRGSRSDDAVSPNSPSKG
jgi:23S rRNA (guanosine2251-2'-O)-methyltransferase